MAITSTPTPAWDVATLFPPQGNWDESDYLNLTDNTRRLVEFVDGRIEVLPMPKMSHQKIVHYLANLLLALNIGTVVFAPFRVRVRAGKYREPDVAFMLEHHSDRVNEDFWEGADLVIEVVSDDDRDRDYVTKLRDYAEAGIGEYWIVDPVERKITQFELVGSDYQQVAEAREGAEILSKSLPGLVAQASAIFRAGGLL